MSKQTFYILVFTLAFLACNEKTEVISVNSNINKLSKNNIKLHKLRKLFIVGDFDGNGEKDTILQHNYSGLTKSEIKYSADPFQNKLDTVVKWFNYQEANVYLTINTNNQDTLNLGIAQGLYCLINIGDNNSDGKDELAFVIDYLDYSNLNTCKIYTLCKGKWTLLKQFNILESAFDYTSEEIPNFSYIKDFLEKKDSKWFYRDYNDKLKDAVETKEMQLLKLEKCK